MPLSWVVAALVVYVLLYGLAMADGLTIVTLLKTSDHWLLAVVLPALMFGKIVGLISTNLLAALTPSFRRIFEREEARTGRDGFAKAMVGLAKAAILLGIVTALGSLLFLRYG